MKQRLAAGALALSAAGLVGIALSEGWEPVARPPVAGDVPTVGFGSTRNPDGSAVRGGQVVTPDRALVMLLADASASERAVRRCAPVPMHPYEFSAFISLTYNIGEGAFCGSTLVRKLRAGAYSEACAEILRWDRFQGRRLPGLTARREREYKQCTGEGAA